MYMKLQCNGFINVNKIKTNDNGKNGGIYKLYLVNVEFERQNNYYTFLLFSDQDLDPPHPPPPACGKFCKNISQMQCIDTRILNELINLFSYFPS